MEDTAYIIPYSDKSLEPIYLSDVIANHREEEAYNKHKLESKLASKIRTFNRRNTKCKERQSNSLRKITAQFRR